MLLRQVIELRSSSSPLTTIDPSVHVSKFRKLLFSVAFPPCNLIMKISLIVSVLCSTIVSAVPFATSDGSAAAVLVPSKFNSSVANIPSCLQPPTKSCAFYNDCLEGAHTCGSNGYAIGYGGKFCQAFSRSVSKNEFTPMGETWVINYCSRRQCLACTLNSFIGYFHDKYRSGR